MKPFGSNVDYEEDRKRDLMRAYHEYIDSHEHINLQMLYKAIVNMPSERFWVSEERASVVICSMMKGDTLSSMRPTKREMHYEIFKRAMEMRKKFPHLTILQIAFKVVRQPAPKFYITPSYAQSVILSFKKKWFEERRKKLRHLF
jgi:hypothetical protein